MSSLVTLLLTGASGIYANQTGVRVTGNNIANVNTTGYSRQVAAITSSTQVEQGGLLFGTGATVGSVERTDTTFITKRLVAAAADYGEYEAASSPLGDIEQILAIDETTLATDIDNFFDAWEALGSNPGESSERQQVLMEAEDLVDHFQQISGRLAEVGELCGATTYTDDNGMACLQLENGLPLVVGQVASTLSANRVDGLSQLSLTSGNSSYTLDNSAFGGSLSGLLDVRDTTVPELRDACVSGLAGDNSLCLDMAALADSPAIDGATYTEAYAKIAGKAGLLVSGNEDRLLAGLESVNALQDDRDAIAGASADEEMLLLIQYQSGYEAAANYLSVVKEMLDTLIEM